jgi:arginyl-tRNA synthetase
VREQWRISRDDCVGVLARIFIELLLSIDIINWFYESVVDDIRLGQDAAAELKQLGIAEIDDSPEYKGALYVDFEKHADALKPDGTPVFRDDEKKRIRKLGKLTILRSDGTSLYQTKELGLAKHKFDLVRERYGSDLDESLYVVGAEQKLYFDQVFAILRLWGFPNAENCKHISYELVVLPEGKMSSREGNIVSYRDLRDEAVDRALKITEEKGVAGWIEQTAHDIAIAAIKYAMLQVTGNQQIVFDFEQALSFSGRAAPYLQYAYARGRKILYTYRDEKGHKKYAYGKQRDELLAVSTEEVPAAPGYELHASELMLARELGAFPAVCADAAAHYEPATLCTYLYDLATAFSDFYRDCPVLDAPEDKRAFRRALIAAFLQVMRTGFAILALPLPEEM